MAVAEKEVIMNPVAVAGILSPLHVVGVETSVVEVVLLEMSGVLAGE